ncbi:phage portal protein [Vreelandella sp. H-I2]
MKLLDSIKKHLSLVPNSGGGWQPIHEPFAGAWQRGEEETQGTITAYPIVFACMSRIAQDVGKLPFQLRARDEGGLWREVRNPAYSPFLRSPNSYQTPQQFREAWVLSRLQCGNTYGLKERDNRGVVTAIHLLDPRRVQVLVSNSGDIFYELATDTLNGIEEAVRVPAREIIHDREPTCLFHSLVGVPPLAAATIAASKNSKIDRSQSAFFGNFAQPGGILTAPAGMTDDDAKRLKKYWDENFSGKNSGKISVIGADMKFTSLAFNAVDSQLVEQVRYSDEQIAHAFGIPLWKIGLEQLPVGANVDGMNASYFAEALQARIEAMEACLGEGLGLPDQYRIEIDTTVLLRLDEQQQTEILRNLVGSGILAPNEARRRLNLPSVIGGDSPLMQQQNYSLEALARRDQGPDPFATGTAEERAMSPGLRQLKAIHERAVKRRVRFDWTTGNWMDV